MLKVKEDADNVVVEGGVVVAVVTSAPQRKGALTRIWQPRDKTADAALTLSPSLTGISGASIPIPPKPTAEATLELIEREISTPARITPPAIGARASRSRSSTSNPSASS